MVKHKRYSDKPKEDSNKKDGKIEFQAQETSSSLVRSLTNRVTQSDKAGESIPEVTKRILCRIRRMARNSI